MTNRSHPAIAWHQLAAPALAVLLAAITAFAAPAEARVPLNEDEHITHSLVSAAVGEYIRRNCPSIGARYFVVMEKIDELEAYALAQGHTEEEIKAFLRDRDERRRIRAAAQAYLAENGVVRGEQETYCALGRAEIEKETLTGSLLFSWR